jgi:uncharacterized damage-inducible protein DinB
MTNKESFVQLWNMETAVTRKLLDAVPDRNHGWKPDPKARTGLELAGFVAMHAPILVSLLQTGEVKGGPMTPPSSVKEAVAPFSASLGAVDAALKSVDERSWDQKQGAIYGPDGKPMMQAPIGVLAWSTLLDLIHHRGQLSTYIRPMGGKVPSIYGPSADDPGRP